MVNHCFKNEEIKPGHSAGLRDIFFRYFSEFVQGGAVISYSNSEYPKLFTAKTFACDLRLNAIQSL